MELLGAYLAIQQIQRGPGPNNIPHLFEKCYTSPPLKRAISRSAVAHLKCIFQDEVEKANPLAFSPSLVLLLAITGNLSG
jgi:hypothetical protein